MKKWIRFLLPPLFSSCTFYAAGQLFANEIAAFKKQDSISFPHKGAILLEGSSFIIINRDVFLEDQLHMNA